MTAEQAGIMASEAAPDLGVFGDLPNLWEGFEMKCPKCGQNTPDDWLPFWPDSALIGDRAPRRAAIQAAPFLEMSDELSCNIEYMQCANADCQQMIIRFNETRTMTRFDGVGVPRVDRSSSMWVIYPRYSERPIDPLVPEPFRRDYLEAAAILDISARASAMLARRVLADLLEKYAGCDQYKLSDRIEQFRKDTTHPSSLRENLHHFREAADLCAHTKKDKDDQAIIIDVDRDEAEWTLDILDRLFEHFIVAPKIDEEMRARIAKKIERAGRKPIEPLPDKKASTDDDSGSM